MLRIFKAGVPTLLAMSLIAGCSSGGSSPSVTGSSRHSGGAPASFGKSNASAKIVIHAGAASKRSARASRKRQYVSAATQGAIATFVDANMATAYQGYTLLAGAAATTDSPADCTTADGSGNYTCTLYFVLDPTASPYQTTIATYDAAQSGTTGTPVAASGSSSAVAISADTETLAIVANQDNPFSFTLQGIVESFQTVPTYIGVSGSSTNAMTTFTALDGDGNEIDLEDSTSNFAVGTQPSGAFTENASFTVNALDENTCTSASCISTTATSVTNPSNETLSYSYNGQGSGGDGMSTPPYYAAIALSAPSGYSGAPVTVGSASYASAVYIVPFFGFVDTTSPFATDATHVSFVTSSNSITIYAAQYHLPDTAMGYSVDTSSCGSGSSAIATASSATLNPGYGASFTLSAGSGSGSCSAVLADGYGDTATISVTSVAGGNSTVTVPCTAPTAHPNVDRSRDLRRVYASGSCPSPSPAPSASPI